MWFDIHLFWILYSEEVMNNVYLLVLCYSRWRQKLNILMAKQKASLWTTQWTNSKLSGSVLEVHWIAWSRLQQESNKGCLYYRWTLVKLCWSAYLPHFPSTYNWTISQIYSRSCNNGVWCNGSWLLAEETEIKILHDLIVFQYL